MVTVTMPRVRRAAGLGRLGGAVRAARRRIVTGVASGAGSTLRGVLAAVVALRGVAGLVLVAYGCWLAYPPAGFMVGGVLLLADRLLDERGSRSS